MRMLYVIAALALGAAVVLGIFANDAREAAARIRSNNDALQEEIGTLMAEAARLEQVDPAPLRFSADALSEFVTRTVEAGEVLGAGVRVQPRDASMGVQAMSFQHFREGLQVCPVTLQAGLEAHGAAAILAMFEEELADLPVAVRKINARSMTDAVVLTMDVDVFGRSP